MPSLRFPRLYSIGLLVALCVAALAAVRCGSAPLKTYASLDPTTAYVGREACQPCHKKIYASYAHTGMSRSLYPPKRSESIEKTGREIHVYDAPSDLYYSPYWENDSFYIAEYRLKGRDTVHKRVEKVDFIVGSGNATRSYLMQRNGYMYEFPITWYVHKQIWDMSPGYEGGKNARFSREVGEECLACHTGHIEFVPNSKNRYQQVAIGIDCEKCHGPGAEHIRRMERDEMVDVGQETDFSIVNPKKLPLATQFDVCQQCHLQGNNVFTGGTSTTDFRPAMALNSVYEVFLPESPNPDAFGIASHAERLQQSKCFKGSGGKLTCTTCHNPHESLEKADATAAYLSTCNGCHNGTAHTVCKASPEKKATMQGNCVSCHLPSGGTADIPHVSFHDHNIRVVRTPIAAQTSPQNTTEAFLRQICATRAQPAADIQGRALLQYFERNSKNPRYLAEAETLLRTRGNAYDRARIAYWNGKFAEAEQLLKSLQTPAEAQFLYGEVLEAQGKYADAHTAYDALYRRYPQAIDAGLKAAVCLLKARSGDFAALNDAENRFKTLLREKPFDERLLTNYAFVLMNKGKLAEAEAQLQLAIRLHPDYQQAQENLTLLRTLQQP